MPRNRLSEEKKALTTKVIQNIAREIFFQKGYTNTTIEEMARMAGIAKGSIYLYFKTKDDLFFSLVFPIMEKINQSLKKMEKGLLNHQYGNCGEVVNGFYDHYREIYKFDPKGMRILEALQEGDLFLAMSEETREKLNAQARNNFKIYRDIIKEAIKQNLFPPLNPYTLIDFFWGSFMGMVQLEESKFRSTGKRHLRATLKMAFSIIADGICALKRNSGDENSTGVGCEK